MHLIPADVINRVILKEKGDRYYKSFSTLNELIILLFGIFERCDSACEVCDGMAAISGKLNYLGMDCAPTKSTFNDALKKRSEQIFEKIYFALLAYFSSFLSVSSEIKTFLIFNTHIQATSPTCRVLPCLKLFFSLNYLMTDGFSAFGKHSASPVYGGIL